MDASSNSPLDWRNHDMFLGTANGGYTLQTEESRPWPIPSRETMHERWAFRQGIREETLQHRRIHRHGGMGETGRNVALVLRDREIRGASATTLRRRPIDKTEEAKATEVKRPRDSSSASHGRDHETVNGQANDKPGETSARNSLLGAQHQRPQLNKRVCYPTRISHEVQLFAEYCSVIRYHSAFFRHLGGDDEPGERGERPPSSKAVSTISIAFAPNSRTMASTHGDHTVKISCCSSGILLQTLEGHPRTPWTVKYHPSDSAVLASGCLGHQVRLWHWPDKVCLQMIRLEFAIISLSFHPTGNLLAVANGTRLHFWGYNQNTQANEGSTERPGPSAARNSRGILTEVDQRHMLRCVHFPPEGNSIIIGGVNPTTDDPRRRNRGGIGGGGMSFYLRLWDFDIGAALQIFDDNTASMGARRRAISNVSFLDISCSSNRPSASCSYFVPCSQERLFHVLCSTMMAASTFHQTERCFAHVRSIGCLKESTMQWKCSRETTTTIFPTMVWSQTMETMDLHVSVKLGRESEKQVRPHQPSPNQRREKRQ